MMDLITEIYYVRSVHVGLDEWEIQDAQDGLGYCDACVVLDGHEDCDFCDVYI
jgi:hypothetical protein